MHSCNLRVSKAVSPWWREALCGCRPIAQWKMSGTLLSFLIVSPFHVCASHLFHGFMMFHDVSCFFCLCSSCKSQLHATRRSICSWKWFGSQVLSGKGWVAHFKSAHLQSKGWKWWCCLRDGQGHSVGPQESHTWCKMILEWTATAAYCTSCFFNRNNVSVSRFSREFVSRIFHFREFVFFKFFSNLSLNSQGKGPLPSRRWWVARCMKVLGRL